MEIYCSVIADKTCAIDYKNVYNTTDEVLYWMEHFKVHHNLATKHELSKFNFNTVF